MLAESSIIWWSGVKKHIENRCNIFTPCMISCKKLKYQLPSTDKIRLSILTKPGHEIQIGFSGKLHNKYVTGEPYILIKIDPCIKWFVVRICKSTETELKKFLESFINFTVPLRKYSPIREARPHQGKSNCNVKIGTSKVNTVHLDYVLVRGG